LYRVVEHLKKDLMVAEREGVYGIADGNGVLTQNGDSR
jgi:hypothetical protein